MLLVLISTVISVFMSNFGIDKESIIMVYLVGVLIVTVVTKGYIYGAVASVLSVLMFNYLFTVPIHTFMIYNPSDVSLLLFFFIASLISSSLTSRFQEQLVIAEEKKHTACLLYEITNSFLNITGKNNIIMQGIKYIYYHTGYASEVELIDDNEIYRDNMVEIDKSNTMVMELDIHRLKKKIGTIKIFYKSNDIKLDSELLIKMVVTQMGITLDREFIYNERENIRIKMEREHLRSNLLRGISHDLRTPLTAIVGASGVILEDVDKLDLESIKKLVKDINEESLWLNNLVENILNMTRIGEGKMVIQKQDEVVDDIIDEALRHISGLINNRNIDVSFPDEVISVPMDGKLIVQVLINLLDNAIKHTKENEEIHLNVFTKDSNIVFEVADEGCGIDEKIKDSLFKSFVTSGSKVIDGKRGMGLGLAICKAIVNAHGGEITAENRDGKGAVFKFTLPLMEE